MSDTLNALSQAGMMSGQQQGQSNLLSMLSGAHVANPAGALQAGTQAAGSVVDLRQKQFNLQQAQLQPAYQAMRQIMTTNTDPSWGDVQNALAQSARIGGNIDGLVANANETMARGGKPGDFVRATALGGMSPETQGTYVYPQRMNVNTGSNLVYGTTPGLATPNAGQFNPAGSIGLDLSPAQATDMIQVGVNPDGSPIMKPRGAAFGQPYGGGGGGGGVAPGGGGGGGGVVAGTNRAPNQAAFIQSFTPVAQQISAKTGLPVDYLIGQAGLETGWGTSSAYQNNNYFGISPGGQPASYATPQAGIDAYVNLMQADRYRNVPRTGSPQQIGDAMAVAGYNPNVPRQGSGDSYGARIGNFAPGPGGGQPPGVFIGATSAQPVTGGAPVQPMGAGGGNVQPAGGMQYFSPTGQPIGPGGGAGGQGGAAPYQGYTGLPATFEKTAGASADIFNTARANYTQQAQRISPLEQSLATLRAHPDLQTGMTAMDFQNINSLAQVLGVQLSPKTIADGSALTEINKNLNRYYRGLPGANRSDMAELDAKLANPSPENQRDALDDLLARTIGAERMNDAGYMHFLELHGSGNASNYAYQYADQTGQYTSKLDPVGFAFDKMTTAQRRAYFDSLSPTERTRYMNSIKEASRLYNLPIPQGGG